MSKRVLAECGIAPLAARTVGDWQFCPVELGALQFLSTPDALEVPNGTQALVCTSPRVAQWLVQGPKRNLPVFTAGPSTQAIFAQAKWQAFAPQVEGGAGACALLEEHLPQVHGTVVFPTVAESAGTVEHALHNHPRFQLHRQVVCENRCAESLPALAKELLANASALWFRSPSALRHLFQLDPGLFTLLSQKTFALSGGECLPLLRHHNWAQFQVCSSRPNEIVQILQKVFP